MISTKCKDASAGFILVLLSVTGSPVPGLFFVKYQSILGYIRWSYPGVIFVCEGGSAILVHLFEVGI